MLLSLVQSLNGVQRSLTTLWENMKLWMKWLNTADEQNSAIIHPYIIPRLNNTSVLQLKCQHFTFYTGPTIHWRFIYLQRRVNRSHVCISDLTHIILLEWKTYQYCHWWTMSRHYFISLLGHNPWWWAGQRCKHSTDSPVMVKIITPHLWSPLLYVCFPSPFFFSAVSHLYKAPSSVTQQSLLSSLN